MKVPERVDIFNNRAISESLKEAFERTVRQDFKNLKTCFMQEKLAFEVINEKFNFVENFVDTETFENVSFA